LKIYNTNMSLCKLDLSRGNGRDKKDTCMTCGYIGKVLTLPHRDRKKMLTIIKKAAKVSLL
jgi:hypothetical protein